MRPRPLQSLIELRLMESQSQFNLLVETDRMNQHLGITLETDLLAVTMVLNVVVVVVVVEDSKSGDSMIDEAEEVTIADLMTDKETNEDTMTDDLMTDVTRKDDLMTTILIVIDIQMTDMLTPETGPQDMILTDADL